MAVINIHRKISRHSHYDQILGLLHKQPNRDPWVKKKLCSYWDKKTSFVANYAQMRKEYQGLALS